MLQNIIYFQYNILYNMITFLLRSSMHHFTLLSREAMVKLRAEIDIVLKLQIGLGTADGVLEFSYVSLDFLPDK